MNPYSPWMGGMHPRTRGMFGMRQGLSPYASRQRFMAPSARDTMADPYVNELFYDAPRRGGYGGYGGYGY